MNEPKSVLWGIGLMVVTFLVICIPGIVELIIFSL